MYALSVEKVSGLYNDHITYRYLLTAVRSSLGFYRKDHLRKHTRSHIARRVKSEVSAQNVNGSSGGGGGGGGGGGNSAQSNALHGS